MGLPTFSADRFPADWRPVVSSWAAHLAESGTSPATVSGYALHVQWLAEHMRTAPWDVTPEQLSDWLDGHNWATVTRRKVLSSLRSFYRWALEQRYTTRSPLAGIAAAPPRKTGPHALPVAPAWEPHVRAWKVWLNARSLSPTTQRTYAHHVRALSELVADPWAVTPTDLARFLSRDDLAPETKKSARVALRGFYGWACQVGHIDTDPSVGLPTIRIPRTIPRPASEEAVAAAFAAADDRTRLILAIACFAGLRIGEIARLHTRDVGTDTLRVTGKGGHVRLVPLHCELQSILRTEMRNRRGGVLGTGWTSTRPPQEDGWLFPSVDESKPLSPGHIGKLIDSVLPKGWTPHTLRHRFATAAYAAERDLRAVQDLLGHASPNTTIRYAAVPNNALRQSVAGIPRPTSMVRSAS